MSNRKEVDWQKQIDKTVRFANRGEFEVLFYDIPSKISFVNFNSRKINIHIKNNKEKQLYILLHELGHCVINNNYDWYRKNVGYSFFRFSKKSLTHKVAIIEEEVEAWRVGYNIAKQKLRLRIDREKYEKIKAQNLKTYFNWISK